MPKILEVLPALGHGGAEIMILNLINSIKSNDVQIDFLVNGNEIGPLEESIKLNHHNIYHISDQLYYNIPKYYSALKKIMLDHGPYDIVHSHLNYLGAFVMSAAKSLNIPVRICHSHCTDFSFKHRSLLHKCMFYLMRHFMNSKSTRKLACSKQAGISLFGKSKSDDVCVLNNSIDAEKFAEELSLVERAKLKEEFNIPCDAFVLGQVGRFIPLKNHSKTLRVFNEILKINPNSHLVLVGDGPLLTQIKSQAEELNISDFVTFTGGRNDVYKILKILDVCILPSLHEGFPLVLTEAQAAGVKCVVTDTINKAINFFDMITFIPFSESDQYWAHECLDNTKNYPDPCVRVELLKRLCYDIQTNVEVLKEIYGITR
ncbi:MAG: glycosyltransferase [Christensenellaceae bacterium]|jgi:glycosyltransferase involved in cell wall biosynthesis|nr:glycosyltransferase [Christensenellaceae bacterium]